MALIRNDFESFDYDGPEVVKEDAHIGSLEQDFDARCRAAEVAALQQSALQHAVSSCLNSCLDCLDLLYVNREETPITAIALEHDSWRQEAEPEPCSKDSWLRGAIPDITLQPRQQSTSTTSAVQQTPLLAARSSRVREKQAVSKRPGPGSVSSVSSDVGRKDVSNVASTTQPPCVDHTSSTLGIETNSSQQQTQEEKQQEQQTQKRLQHDPWHLLQAAGAKANKTEQQEAQDRLRQELKLRRQQDALVKELQQKDEQAHSALLAMQKELKGKEYTYDSKGRVVLLAPPKSLPVPPGPQFKLHTPPAAPADPAQAATPSRRGASSAFSSAGQSTTTSRSISSGQSRAAKGAAASACNQREFVPTASPTQPPLLETVKPAAGVLVKAGAGVKQGPRRDTAAQPTRSQYQQQAKAQIQQAARSAAAVKAANSPSLGGSSRLSSTGSNPVPAGPGAGGKAVSAAVSRRGFSGNGAEPAAATGSLAGNTVSNSRLIAATEAGGTAGDAWGPCLTAVAADAQPAQRKGAASATPPPPAAAAAAANVGAGTAKQGGMHSAATANVNMMLLAAEDWGVASAGTSYSPPELSKPTPADSKQIREEFGRTTHLPKLRAPVATLKPPKLQHSPTAANRPSSSYIRSSKRSVIVRFRDQESPDTHQSPIPRGQTDSKLSTQQLTEVQNKEEGNVSPRMAELRADLGNSVTDLSQLQTFDGPAPETINGRLAMLAVVTGLAGEWLTGKGLLEQTADHPVVVFASFVIISIATYVPLFKGHTRKEPFANSFLGLNWTPQAENWNGRLAMMGFTGMILTEAIAGCNTLQAWGLQPLLFSGLH
eukprot:gene6950-biopygen8745